MRCEICLIHLDPDTELQSGRTASDPMDFFFFFLVSLFVLVVFAVIHLFWPALAPPGLHHAEKPRLSFVMSSSKGGKKKDKEKYEKQTL